MNNLLVAAIWLGVLVSIYIVGYILNKKTPRPSGCEDLTAECDGCQSFDCTHNPAHQKEEVK